MRNLLVVLLFALCVSACKHDPVVSLPDPFAIIPSSVTLHAGDSFAIRTNDNNVSWSLSPEIGQVTPLQYYKAPSSLRNDSLTVTLHAVSGAAKASCFILLIKKDANDTAITFTETILPLMESNCNFKGCHGNGSKAGRVELNNYTNTMKTVYPYQPDKSLLYISLLKTDPLRRMPPAGALHQYRIDFFKKWIEQGAVE